MAEGGSTNQPAGKAVDVMHKVFSSEKTELARFFTKIIPPASRADLLETLRTQLSEHFSLEENASLAKHRRENIHLKIPSLKRIYSLDSEEQYSLHRETLTERPCELLYEVHEIAYTTPATTIRTRNRGMTKESQDDFSLQNCILNGTKNLDTIRSELQKHKFAEFKQVVSEKYQSRAIDELTIECGKCCKPFKLNRMRYHRHFGDNAKAHYVKCGVAVAPKRSNCDIREMFKASAAPKNKQQRFEYDVTESDWNTDDMDYNVDEDWHNYLYESDPVCGEPSSPKDSNMIDLTASPAAENLGAWSDSDDEDVDKFFVDHDDYLYHWPDDRVMYTVELDPLTVLVQETINAKTGFDSSHIFYKVIHSGLQAINRDNQGFFEWPTDIIDFAQTLDHHGGEKISNIIRGPGMSDQQHDVSQNWKSINIPFPSKSSRMRRKRPSVKENGVLTDHLRQFVHLCSAVSPVIETPTVRVTPVCIARDAMAIKPCGEYDQSSHTIVGLHPPIDLKFVKENPYPKPSDLKDKFYTEAGAVIATTLNKEVCLHLANDFLLSKTSGADVYSTISDTIAIIQTCWECLQHVDEDIVKSSAVNCSSNCKDCSTDNVLCDRCDGVYSSTYAQLRPCSRCLGMRVQCQKVAVFAVSMDCESNNQSAMNSLDDKSDCDKHMALTFSVPDAVHAGKKLYRASANWWLYIDGYRVNNSIIRCLRQHDPQLSKPLCSAVSDSCLRNRDRMDYGAILESTDVKVRNVIESQTSYDVTMTVFPDPFWRNKTRNLLQSVTDITVGPNGYIFVLDGQQCAVVRVKLKYPPEADIVTRNLPKPACIAYSADHIFIGCPKGIILLNKEGKKVKKKNLVKSELIRVAINKKLIPDRSVASEFTKQQLLDIIGEVTDDSGQSHELLKLPHSIYPSAMCRTENGIYAIDIPTSSVWLVTENNAVHTFNLPNVSQSTSISNKGDKIYVVTNLGLHLYTEQECTLIIPRNICSMYGVCSNDATVFVSDGSDCIYRVEGRELVLISGVAQPQNTTMTSSDALSHNSRHAQPGMLCMEGNSIFVCDRASCSVRLVSSVKPLLDYHQQISSLYRAFGVHTKQIGFKEATPMDQVAILMSEITQYLDGMVQGVRIKTSNPELRPNGPDGCVPFVTVAMFHQLSTNIETLKDLGSKLEYNIHPGSLLSVPVEHHFAVMRSRYAMPTYLQYCDLLSSVVSEHVKRITTCAFKYYTSSQSYYPNPDFQSLPPIPLPPVVRKRSKSKKAISESDQKLMMNWRKDFCAGVRQKTVRQMSTMDNPGTLPIFVYDNASVPEFERLEESLVTEIPDLEIVTDPDDIPVITPQQRSTRSGRVSKAPNQKDIICYSHH